MSIYSSLLSWFYTQEVKTLGNEILSNNEISEFGGGARNLPSKFLAEKNIQDFPQFIVITESQLKNILPNLKKVITPESQTKFESRNPVVNELHKYFKEHNFNY